MLNVHDIILQETRAYVKGAAEAIFGGAARRKEHIMAKYIKHMRKHRIYMLYQN